MNQLKDLDGHRYLDLMKAKTLLQLRTIRSDRNSKQFYLQSKEISQIQGDRW